LKDGEVVSAFIKKIRQRHPTFYGILTQQSWSGCRPTRR